MEDNMIYEEWQRLKRKQRAIIKKYTKLKWHKKYYWSFYSFSKKSVGVRIKDNKMRYVALLLRLSWKDVKHLTTLSQKEFLKDYLEEYAKQIKNGTKRINRKMKHQK